MSTLLNKIRRHSNDAAKALEDANIRSDKDIKTLTREDLNELLPGKDKFKLRRGVFEIINKKKPTSELLREVKEFIPDGSLRAALSNNGVLVDYLHILKEMKSQVDQVQEFFDAHINFLEESRKDTPPHSESGRDNQVPASTGFHRDQTCKLPQGAQGNHVPASTGSLRDQTYGLNQGTQGNSVSANYGSSNDQAGGHSWGGQDSSGGDVQMGSPSGSSDNDSDGKNSYVNMPRKDVFVPYKAVVCGTTFGADQQVLDKLKANVPLSETNNDQKYTLLFCVISSRVGSDVDAALAEVKDDKPIILVLMHHSHTPSVTTPLRTWAHDDNDTNVLMHVDVFFHEKLRGLVSCRENDDAISQLQTKLGGCPWAKVERSGQDTGEPKNTRGSKNSKNKFFPKVSISKNSQ